MKKFVCMMMVVTFLMMVVGTMMAHAEATIWSTDGTLKGQWNLSQETDESGFHKCSLTLEDGRIIYVPLTDAEFNDLMLKALGEDQANRKRAEKDAAREKMNIFQKAGDWITFWD